MFHFVFKRFVILHSFSMTLSREISWRMKVDVLTKCFDVCRKFLSIQKKKHQFITIDIALFIWTSIKSHFMLSTTKSVTSQWLKITHSDAICSAITFVQHSLTRLWRRPHTTRWLTPATLTTYPAVTVPAHGETMQPCDPYDLPGYDGRCCSTMSYPAMTLHFLVRLSRLPCDDLAVRVGLKVVYLATISHLLSMNQNKYPAMDCSLDIIVLDCNDFAIYFKFYHEFVAFDSKVYSFKICVLRILWSRVISRNNYPAMRLTLFNIISWWLSMFTLRWSHVNESTQLPCYETEAIQQHLLEVDCTCDPKELPCDDLTPLHIWNFATITLQNVDQDDYPAVTSTPQTLTRPWSRRSSEAITLPWGLSIQQHSPEVFGRSIRKNYPVVIDMFTLRCSHISLFYRTLVEKWLPCYDDVLANENVLRNKQKTAVESHLCECAWLAIKFIWYWSQNICHNDYFAMIDVSLFIVTSLILKTSWSLLDWSQDTFKFIYSAAMKRCCSMMNYPAMISRSSQTTFAVIDFKIWIQKITLWWPRYTYPAMISCHEKMSTYLAMILRSQDHLLDVDHVICLRNDLKIKTRLPCDDFTFSRVGELKTLQWLIYDSYRFWCDDRSHVCKHRVSHWFSNLQQSFALTL